MHFLHGNRGPMKRKRWQNKLTQFSYDHRKIDSQLSKLRKSAGELNHMLNNMTPRKDNKTEEKEEKTE